jgi:hypothetical protein
LVSLPAPKWCGQARAEALQLRGAGAPFVGRAKISAGTALELTASAGFVETAAVAAKFST